MSDELTALRSENDTLRALLGNSALPCQYCGLPAEDQAKCASGFPGCSRADDQALSQHFADGYLAACARAELAAAKETIAGLERDARRYRWLRDNVHKMYVKFDATYDDNTKKPAASFVYFDFSHNREWDTKSDSKKRIDAAIDAALERRDG